MIRLQKIHIHEFRGIRDLTLEINGDNFAICGPNGTGKSGVVDAIEFAITGNISRLSGRGTGRLSVKEHGPHVDSRAKSEQAFVTLTFNIPSLRKEATIHRTVKSPNKPTITPDELEIRAALGHVEEHPEFVLSRRELIRYVLAEPGERAKEVQALLRLEKLETLRTTLQKIYKAYERDIKLLENGKQRSRDDLLKALGIAKWAPPTVLEEVNKRRAILSLPEITEFKKDASIKDGLTTVSSSKTVSRVPKAQALKDIESLKGLLEGSKAQTFQDSCASVLTDLSELNADADSLESLSHENLLQTALKLFDNEHCPVCDTEWVPEEFKKMVAQKLEHLATVKQKKEALDKKIEPIAAALETLSASLATTGKYSPALPKPLDVQALKAQETALSEAAKQLRKLLPLSETIKVLEDDIADFKTVEPVIEELEKAVTAIPEPSQQDAARDYLVAAQERLETYREALRQLESCTISAAHSKKVFEKYGEVITQELNTIYKDVEKAFRNHYRMINHDDEGAFEALLTPSMGKLGFDVDFYGRGFFPPGAYHSEGHQDGMGLCLYLALMEHLLDNNFTFAVLDDVLMSVDSGHRREVCNLLKQKFPDTQFIFTTHDDIWLRHMQTAGLIKNKGFVHFRTWSVDLGPTEWDDRDIWQEIDSHLASNDVRAAAGLLRHYLEYLSKELCHRLRAPVVFRGDAQFNLGDLLPPGVKRLRDLLRDGKKAAESWGQDDNKAKIEAMQEALNKAVKDSEVEQWQINAAVHYNEWASLQKNDFEPVVENFKHLTGLLECEKCSELFYVTPERGKKESLRCSCGDTNINLVSE